MQVESNVRPLNRFQIEERGNSKVAVLFFDEITETQKEEQTIYKYNMYTLETEKQSNLNERIESNYTTWLEFAKKQEIDKLSAEVRDKRDSLLAKTDWTQMTDTALTTEKQQEYQKYRQELRDITQQPGFPYNVMFPQMPQK